MDSHKVEIPESFLVMIAACGKMGDGELLRFHQFWAQGECSRLGLDDKVREYQKSVVAELKSRLKNTIRSAPKRKKPD